MAGNSSFLFINVIVFLIYQKGKFDQNRSVLEEIQKKPAPLSDFNLTDVVCPIQQGLADENPDVDIFTNPKYKIDYKLGVFNQKATIRADVMGATLKLK